MYLCTQFRFLFVGPTQFFWRLLRMAQTFGKLPELFGGKDSGGGDDIIAYDSIVRVVRETWQMEKMCIFVLHEYN